MKSCGESARSDGFVTAINEALKGFRLELCSPEAAASGAPCTTNTGNLPDLDDLLV